MALGSRRPDKPKKKELEKLGKSVACPFPRKVLEEFPIHKYLPKSMKPK